ncbi:CsgG/HfaB family protein [Pajaroellobacter abortibovis]|nr:CsgG/HfaB family protein [Pajaroellobacter abortibovis]
MRKLSCGVVSLSLLLNIAGCRKEYIRGANNPSVDAPAMSTGLDKDDIGRMLNECLNHLGNSPVMQFWREHQGKARVAIFPFQNETSEHIDSQLQAVLSETETWLVESNTVMVISRERQLQMIKEVEGFSNAAFNPNKIGQYGRQLGAQYIVTGKVQASDERTDSMRRVQYFLFMQVIEVETSAIKWQHKSYVTKAIR